MGRLVDAVLAAGTVFGVQYAAGKSALPTIPPPANGTTA